MLSAKKFAHSEMSLWPLQQQLGRYLCDLGAGQHWCKWLSRDMTEEFHWIWFIGQNSAC
jgi:hypothetical protein